MRFLLLSLLLSAGTAQAYLTSSSTSGGGAWGTITGTLSSQTDLQTALNAKAGLTANTFTDTQTVTKNSLGATTADGVKLQNTTAATGSVQQVSPRLRLEGQQFRSNSSLSKNFGFDQYVLPVIGLEALGTWRLGWYGDNSSPSYILDVINKDNSSGQPKLTVSGTETISVNASNTVPGTVDHLTLTNPSGGNTHTAYKFGSTIKAGVSVSSSGAMDTRSTSTQSFYVGGSSIIGSGLIAQIFNNGFYNSYANFNAGVVTAGLANQSPKATLTTYGGYASKGKLITSNYQISNTPNQEAQFYYCDTGASTYCGGTPTTACSGYTYAGCPSSLGCSASLLGNCSSYNGTDPTTCSSANPACSWSPGNCGAFSDESSCNSNTACSWTNIPLSCEGLDEFACASTSGCTVDTGDCASTFFDESSCNAQTGCSWDGGSSVCTGSYFTGCSGSYDNYSCQGDYYAGGTCNGGDYGNCTGVASCAGLGTGAGCSAVAGCSVITGIEVTLPELTGHIVQDTGDFLGIKKLAGTGSVTIKTQSPDTFEDGSTSITLSTSNASFMFHPLQKRTECSVFTDSTSCTGASCTWFPGCASFGDGTSCENAGCTWDPENSSCSGTSANCSGTPLEFSKWFKW